MSDPIQIEPEDLKTLKDELNQKATQCLGSILLTIDIGDGKPTTMKLRIKSGGPTS